MATYSRTRMAKGHVHERARDSIISDLYTNVCEWGENLRAPYGHATQWGVKYLQKADFSYSATHPIVYSCITQSSGYGTTRTTRG